MILYCNGCSYSYGTELSLNGDLTLAWPYLVANKLDAKLINGSKGGQSNLMIYKKTVEDILSLERKPDLAIIQWTFIERFDTPVGNSYQFKYPENNLQYQTHYPFVIHKTDNENNEWYKNYYDIKSIKHMEYLTDISMFYMYMLQSFLSAKKIPFIFMDCDNNRRYGSASYKIKNKLYSQKLEKSRWLHGLETSVPEILFSYNYKLCKKIDKNNFPDDHFMADAHEFVSESLLDFYYLNDKLLVKDKHILNRQRDTIHFYGDDM